jgi:hypothetical protein
VFPRIRNPLMSWLLSVFTGGIYLIFWVGKVTAELNFAENKKVFKIEVWRNALIVLLLLVVAGFVLNNPLLFAMTFIGLFILVIYVQLAIGSYIKLKDKELKTGASYSNALSILSLWLVANLGVAYMQSGINRVIECSRDRAV